MTNSDKVVRYCQEKLIGELRKRLNQKERKNGGSKLGELMATAKSEPDPDKQNRKINGVSYAKEMVALLESDPRAFGVTQKIADIAEAKLKMFFPEVKN